MAPEKLHVGILTTILGTFFYSNPFLQRHKQWITSEEHRNTIKPKATLNVNRHNQNWTHQWLVDRSYDPARIYFVHVGKTGGITLERGVPIETNNKRIAIPCIMEKMEEGTSVSLSLEDAVEKCSRQTKPKKLRRQTPALSKHILSHKHLFSALFTKEEMDWILARVNTFLITTRNPVDRIVSAFNYHRNELLQLQQKNPMKKRFYSECFRDVKDMANQLAVEYNLSQQIIVTTGDQQRTFNASSAMTSKKASTAQQPTCVQLAQAILGDDGEWGHFAYNYHYYKEVTMDKRPDVPVLVIRTEKLWQDATQLELALGGDPNRFSAANQTMSHGSEGYEVTAKLSTAVEKQAICCAIYNDVQAYQSIIMAALNLNDDEKLDMMRLVWKDCGVDVNDGEEEELLLSETNFWEHWFNVACSRPKR